MGKVESCIIEMYCFHQSSVLLRFEFIERASALAPNTINNLNMAGRKTGGILSKLITCLNQIQINMKLHIRKIHICLPKYFSTMFLHKLNENHRVLCQIHTVECYNHNYLINPPLKANTAHFTAKAH